MKKNFLLSFSILAICMLGFIQSNAQFSAIMKPRLVVNSPSSVAGVKNFSFSSSSTTGSWGRAIDSSWWNVELVKPSSFEACGTLGAGSLAGKWALVLRGNCEFGVKAKNCQDAGAKGVIIINQHPGEGPVGMGAGAVGNLVTIPVLMISYEDGMALNAAMGSGSGFVSLTAWGFGFAHDLTLVPNSVANAPYGAIPVTQLDGTDIANYRGYTGAFIANVGTSDETGLKVRNEVSFTPTGGSTSVVYTDSVVVTDTLQPIDSMELNAFSPRSFKFNGALGRYDIKTTVVGDSADNNAADNSLTHSMEVTAQIFCKSRLNPTNGEPISNGGLRSGNTALAGIMWGPLMYINKGGYGAQEVKFTVSDGDTSKHDLTSLQFVGVFLFKWVDGNSDNIMEQSEMTLKSIAVKEFTTLDSNNDIFSAPFGNASTGEVGTPIVLDGSSWYWAGVSVPSTMFLGVDNNLSYFNRSNAAANFATNKVKDYWSPLFEGTSNEYNLITTDSLKMIPFGTLKRDAALIDSTPFLQTIGVPAVAFYTTVHPVSVKNVKATAENRINVYPNPAAGDVNIDLALPQAAKNAQVQIVDAMGRVIYIEKLYNVQNTKVTFSAAKLAPGNYYAVVMYDGANSAFKQFSVVK